MKKLSVTPRGNRVIIEQDKVEETYGDSEIIVKYENELAEQASIIRGTVRAIAEDCWTAWSEPWAEVGDRIYFAKHAGKQIFDPMTGDKYLIMNDVDIIATLDNEKKDD